MHPRCLPCDEAGLPCEETSLPCDEASLPCEAAILPHVSACTIDADLVDSPATPLVFNDSIDTTNMTNVVLIDSTLVDKQVFYDSANANTFPIIYDYNSKTDDLLALFRQKFPASSIQRISLVFHDRGPNLQTPFMNNSILFQESDLEVGQTCFSENLSFLISCIKEFHVSHIDFLACNTLQYSNWKSYYALLASQTSVVVGASNDATGNMQHGGDWIMESTSEDVMNVYFNANISNYVSLLASSIPQSGGTILLQMNPANGLYVQYSQNGGSSWTDISGVSGANSWPITFTNNTPAAGTILTIKLVTDISMSTTYTAGTNGYFIAGSQYVTFDGSSNYVRINGIASYPGFIQNGTSGASAQANVVVRNFTTAISGTSTLGSSAGWLCQSYFGRGVTGNLITNCANTGTISGTSAGGIAGGFAGYFGSATFTNCTNSGLISGGNAGGIAGQQSGFGLGASVIFTNCANSGTISVANAGGIAGYAAGYTNGSATFTACTNTGPISGRSAGGITGVFAGFTNGSARFTNCTNSQVISGVNAGGIVGSQSGQTNGLVTLTNCFNTGLISGQYAGGIAGAIAGLTNGLATITNCTNSGAISGQYAGGIAGSQAGQTNGLVTLTNCFSTGLISGQYAGGIAGLYFAYDTSRNCVISQCYSTGAISGNNAGGIVGADVGYTDNASIIPNVNITNSYSLGAVSTTAGGICGGTVGSTYAVKPIITITNCYSFGTLSGTGAGLVAISLTSPTSKINLTTPNTYVAAGAWTDAAANASLALIGTPTNINTNNPGSIWTTLAVNTPYVLSAYNAALYSPSSASTTSSTYTSAAGLFSPGYNYQIIYTDQVGDEITARVFASKGSAPYYNSYNSNTFTLSILTGLYAPSVIINPSTGAMYFILSRSPTSMRNVPMISGGGGAFWFGEYGFLYKRKGGGGGRRSTKMAPGGNTTCNGPTYIYNKYNPGNTGVGAQSTAVRRAKNIKAAVCGPKIPCGQFYNYLGRYDNYTSNPNGYFIYPRPNF